MPDTAEAFLRDLDSPDEATRKVALLALGREREPRSIPPIRRLAASDESVELRFLAKKVLLYLAGALAAPEAAGGPAALDAADPAARIRALNVAAASGATDALAPIRARVAVERDAGVRASLATALGALGGRPEIELLEVLAADADPRVRANTIEALEAIGDPAAYPTFVRSVSDPDNRIRANAIRALGKLGRANTSKLLLAMIRSRKTWMIESALYVLVPMQQAEAIPTYEELLTHASREIRSRARAGLARLAGAGSDAARAALSRAPAPDPADGAPASMDEVEVLARPARAGEGGALDAPTADERLALLRNAEAAGDRDALPQLIHRLEVEEAPKVRAVLVRLVGKLGDAGLIPVLETCLRDDDGRVRANAVEAIAAFAKEPAQLKCLEPLLYDDNNRAKTNAVLALWGKIEKGPVGAMKELAASADKNTRLSAIYAIHQLGEAASSLLSPLVTDADPDVRAKALECRKMLGLEEPPEEAAPDGAPAPAARTTGKAPAVRGTGKSAPVRAPGKPSGATPAAAPAAAPAGPVSPKALKILALVIGLCALLKLVLWLM